MLNHNSFFSCPWVHRLLSAALLPLLEHNPHKAKVLITIIVRFDLLFQTNLQHDYTPSAHHHGSGKRISFPQQLCKSMSQRLTNQTEICDSFCPSWPWWCPPTEGRKDTDWALPMFGFNLTLDILGSRSQILFFRNSSLRLFVSSFMWQILIIQKHKTVKVKVFHRICFFVLTYKSGSKVLSLQDCTPPCLLKGDLLSSHFTPGIKSAHTQTYTHKVENIRPHTYIIAHSSLINHEKKLHGREFRGDYCFLNRLIIVRFYGVEILIRNIISYIAKVTFNSHWISVW